MKQRRARSLKAAPAGPEAPAPAPAASTAPSAQASITAHAAAIAAVLATPCQNTEVTPEAGNLALVRAAVLCLINRKRAENGESPLQLNAQLEQAAEGHCQELIADDYFAHVSPTGETPVDRIRETGYIPNSNVGYVIGENLAWGTYQLSTPQAIVAAWIASPGHLANILESQYTETGIGVTPAVPASLGGGAPGATYAQEFGVIIP
ncbi:MAG TPA: CAP domain-containing protein [Solirubrobacteraceae bacterium]|nr:CAP domain-containing protein [Solirubrobacteraceae bacterium]